MNKRLLFVLMELVVGSAATAHEGHGNDPHNEIAARRARLMNTQPRLLVSYAAARPASQPTLAGMFAPFAPRVKTRWDERFLYVESDGLPAHPMMRGITAWQQQVPLPQPYTGDNAWRIPLVPVPAKEPATIRGRFLRGAIALAANGIPIFNPQNNRGEVSAEIGELDQWGGHCGRADDYHYHAAPLHLQQLVGPDQPIAVALDGYPLFGLTEPDGSTPKGLDALHGHATKSLGYHYHASTSYPYVNGGFHGQVVESDGQVDPQPRARPVRPALPPLRGAVITNFVASADGRSFAVQYAVDGRPGAVNVTQGSQDTWDFAFRDGQDHIRTESYRANGPPGAPPRPARPEGRPDDARRAPAITTEAVPRRSGHFILTSAAVTNGGALPKAFTGDGEGLSPPLSWHGAPAGTKSFAVIMHHVPGPGDVKWYWVMYDIPGTVTELPKDAQGPGILGNNSINRRMGYAPPHSKGPGAKTYILTVYALSDRPRISTAPADVSRAVLLEAIEDLILDTAELKFTYTRPGGMAER